jgi:hypothetical protein
VTVRPGTGKKALVLALHAIVLWALCAAVMGVGMSFLPLRTTLAIHALAAPIFAAAAAAAYTSRFGHAGPLATASFFLAFVVVVDFFLVALVINRSLDMFRSVLGTWLPFALIFGATYVTGAAVNRARTRSRRSSEPSGPCS